MSENKGYSTAGGMKYAGLGLAVGLVLGGLVGVLIGNPVIFAGGTMIIGFAIGTALDKRHGK
jgi:hypothetical protein